MMNLVNTSKQLLEQAIELHGSLSELARVTGINRSTLKRIRHNKTNAPHESTLTELVKAIRNGK